MKFVSVLILFCLSFNVLADSHLVQELEAQIDNYQYAMTVEWDQKDKVFYQQKNESFYNNLASLMDRGLTKEELAKAFENKIQNKKMLEALKLKISLYQNLKTDDLIQIIQDSSKDLYQDGASWNGTTAVGIGISALLVGFLAYQIWFDATHECVESHLEYQCHTDEINHGQYYTYCGDVEVCTRYQKK
ncbi:MAG: hypothetical protein AB7I27_12100 [Bacteriovoracaceae bacterium]